MGKKSTKAESGPSKQALPYLQAGSSAVQSAFNANQGNVSAVRDTLGSNLPQVVSQTMNNPTLGAANDYTQDVLSGKYLTGNPYLDAQIKATNGDVADGVNAAIGTRGGAGGSAQAQILARELAKNETGLRYTDYNNERQNMNTAAGNAAGLSNAGDNNIQTLLAYLSGATTIPGQAADQYAGALGNLWGKSTATTSTPSAMSSILNAAGTAASVASVFSDRALKVDIRKLGEMADGLGWYAYRYIWGGNEQQGVMADEVATLRPWALGPHVAGFSTVNYEAL